MIELNSYIAQYQSCRLFKALYTLLPYQICSIKTFSISLGRIQPYATINALWLAYTMLNITYRERKTNIWVREKMKITDVIDQVRKRKWTWAWHVSRIQVNWGHRISPSGNHTKGKGLEEDRRDDELDDYWNGTIWQRIAQDRHL